MMALTGNFAALNHLAHQLQELDQVPSRASATAAQELDQALQVEFTEGTDPFGNPWLPLAPATTRKGRSAPPLTDTGKMRASARAAAERAGLAVHVAPPAPFLEAKRPILPIRGETPGAWEGIVREAVQHELDVVRRS